jgi:prevent-host-death family protein
MRHESTKRLRTILLSDLRSHSATLKLIRRSNGPLVVVKNGKAAAVVLSVRAYERAERERRILRLLAQGEREIAAGKGHDLDEVLKEADRLLAAD